MVEPRLVRLVEMRAQCIRNPVARLRYLRRATNSLPRDERSVWVRSRGALVLSVIACLTLLYPSFHAFNKEETRAQQPAPVVRAEVTPGSTAPANPIEARTQVWLVDSESDHEVYSNGLRVEIASTVRNTPREWTRYNTSVREIAYGYGPPVGIVFHSTESHIAPFAPKENRRLRMAGESVLDYVRRNRSYHYLIDRFGRVHRVVAETDSAFHAGQSIWGDGKHIWMNLNQSFLGVSLEAVTAGDNGDRDPITPAQMHALKTLTAMLRVRYRIPAENCVTHAQVSVNATRRLLGYHTDWASGFPFTAIGLPDNYALPLASMTVFGFGYGPEFLASGAAAWTGLAVSEKQVRRQAAAAGVTVPLYRAHLNEQYRNATARHVRDKESTHEQRF